MIGLDATILVFWVLSFKPAFSLSSFTCIKRLFSSSLLYAIRLVPSAYLGFPGGSDGKDSACKARDLGSIPGSGQSPGEGNGNPIQYSCLENPVDRGAWWATVHSVAELNTTEWLTHTSACLRLLMFLPARQFTMCIIMGGWIVCLHPLRSSGARSTKWTSRAADLYQPCDMYLDDLAFVSAIHIYFLLDHILF